jgi:hypothetical protein
VKELIEHWQSKFRVLAGWEIRLVTDEEFYDSLDPEDWPNDFPLPPCCEVDVNRDEQRAFIYPCPGVDQERYVVHELLHVCVRALGAVRHKDMEELLVRDLVEILFGSGGGQ